MTRLLFWGVTALYTLGAIGAFKYDKLDFFDFLCIFLLVPVLIYFCVWDQHRRLVKERDEECRKMVRGLGVNVDGSYFRGRDPQQPS